MYKVKETIYFSKWLSKLKDNKAKVAIFRRLKRVENGNLGDYKSITNTVKEFRFTTGPAYRIYFTIKGDEVIILLVGGDKSTQSQDIEKAKLLAKEYLWIAN